MASLGSARDLADQSANAILDRLGLHQPELWWVTTLVIVVVVGLTAVRATRLFRDGQRLLAIGLVGCAAVAAVPVAWPGMLVVILLTAGGRIGRRPEDRAIWPIVAVVSAVVPSHVLDPHVDPVTSFLLRNSPGLVAVAACTILPFRRRNDPLWRLPRPVTPTPRRPFGRSWLPLLPARLRPTSRPNLLLELLLIQLGYGAYTWIRNAAPNRTTEAIHNGQDVWRLERFLHIDIEHRLNEITLHADWLMDVLEKYYKTFHFAVPLGVLIWLFWRHPRQFRSARTVLFATTGLALIGFWAFPLAPPRLTPGHGFRDSLHPGANADPFGAFTKLANQFAAMPSLHIGWSTWSAMVIVALAPYLWVRVLGAIYPFVTLFAVVATANHWVLDAVGGVATLALAYLVQYVLTGRHLRDVVVPAAAATSGDPPEPLREAAGQVA